MKKLFRYILISLVLNLFTCSSYNSQDSISHSRLSSFINQLQSSNPQIDHMLRSQKFKEQLLKNNTGARYYLSYIFEAEKQPDFAIKLLIKEIEKKSAFSAYATIRLINLTEKYDKKLSINSEKDLIPLFKQENNKKNAWLLMSLGYITFLEKKYRQSLNYLKSIDEEKLDLYPFANLAKMTATLSEIALDLPEYPNSLNKFFLNNYNNINSKKVLKWIQQEIPNYKNRIPDYQLYNTLNNIEKSKRESSVMYESITNYINTQDSNWLDKYPTLTTHFARLSEKIDKTPNAIQFLKNQLRSLSKESLLQTKITLGNLYFSQKDYKKSLVYFIPSIEFLPAGSQLDRCIIKVLTAYNKLNNSKLFIQKSQKLVTKLTSKVLFRNFFQNVLSELVSKKDFKQIYNLYKSAITTYEDPLMRSHYAWVISRSLIYDLLILAPNLDKKIIYDSMLKETLLVPWSYPAIMAHSILNTTPKFCQNNEKLRHFVTMSEKNNLVKNSLYNTFMKGIVPTKLVNDDTYVLGFIYYGLIEYKKIYPQIKNILRKTRKLNSTNTLRLLGKELKDKELFTDSIRMIAGALERNNFKGKYFDYTILYPKGYENIIESIAKKYNIPQNLLYSLIWNESLFEKDIISRANAIGLGQLLESTAEQIAKLENIKSFNLKDPYDNLLLSSAYLNWLNQRLDKVFHTVMAYNAGITHVKKWLKNNTYNYPPELFIETIPFSETRKYVYNMISDAAIYGCLYQKIPIRNTVKLFF